MNLITDANKESCTLQTLPLIKNNPQTDKKSCSTCKTPIPEDPVELSETQLNVLLQALLLKPEDKGTINCTTCAKCSLALTNLVDLFRQLNELTWEFNKARRDVGIKFIGGWLGEEQETYEGWLEKVKQVEELFPYGGTLKNLQEERSTTDDLSCPTVKTEIDEEFDIVPKQEEDDDEEMFADYDAALEFCDFPIDSPQPHNIKQTPNDTNLTMKTPVALLQPLPNGFVESHPIGIQNPKPNLTIHSPESNMTDSQKLPLLPELIPEPIDITQPEETEVNFQNEDTATSRHLKDLNDNHRDYSSEIQPNMELNSSSGVSKLPLRTSRPPQPFLPSRKRVRSESLEDTNVKENKDGRVELCPTGVTASSEGQEDSDVIFDGISKISNGTKKCPLCGILLHGPLNRAPSSLRESANPVQNRYGSMDCCVTCREKFGSFMVLKSHEVQKQLKPKPQEQKKLCQKVPPPVGVLFPINFYWVPQTSSQTQITSEQPATPSVSNLQITQHLLNPLTTLSQTSLRVQIIPEQSTLQRITKPDQMTDLNSQINSTSDPPISTEGLNASINPSQPQITQLNRPNGTQDVSKGIPGPPHTLNEYSGCPAETDCNAQLNNTCDVIQLPLRELRPRRSVPRRQTSDDDEDVNKSHKEADNDFHLSESDSSTSEDAEEDEFQETDQDTSEEEDSDDENVSDEPETSKRSSRSKQQKCPLCEKHFDRLHRVQSHLKSAHPDSRVSIYSCLTCGEQFESYKVMKKHESTEHSQPKKKISVKEILLKPEGIVVRNKMYWGSQPIAPQAETTTATSCGTANIHPDVQITQQSPCNPDIPSSTQVSSSIQIRNQEVPSVISKQCQSDSTAQITEDEVSVVAIIGSSLNVTESNRDISVNDPVSSQPPTQIIPEHTAVPEISQPIPSALTTQITEEEEVSVEAIIPSSHPPSTTSQTSPPTEGPKCPHCPLSFFDSDALFKHAEIFHPNGKDRKLRWPKCRESFDIPQFIPHISLLHPELYWVSQPTPPKAQLASETTLTQMITLPSYDDTPSEAQITSNRTSVSPKITPSPQITPESPVPTTPTRLSPQTQIIPDDTAVPEISDQIPSASTTQIAKEEEVSVVAIIPPILIATTPNPFAPTEGPKCPHCPLSFFDSDALSKHTGIFHPNGKDRKLRCPKCRESFDIPQFIPHMTQLHPELRATLSSDLRISVAQIQCNFCEMTFTGLSELKSHLCKRHSLDWDDQDTLKCPYCLKLFYNKLKIDSHIHEVHFGASKTRYLAQKSLANAKEAPQGTNVAPSKSPLNILCSICYRIPFPTVSELETHEKTEGHMETLRSKVNVHCNVCRLQFGTDAVALQVHLNSESHLEGVKTLGTFNPDTFCVPCRVDCGNRKEFIAHNNSNAHWKNCAYLGTSLPDEKQRKLGVKCNFCPMSCSSRPLLRRHVNKIHKKGGFCCEFCGKVFTSRPDFLSHRKTHDNVPKPFICTFKDCGRAYEAKNTLQSHINDVHSGGSLICSVCGNLFTSKSSLELHERIQHSKDERKRHHFFCSKCSKGFLSGIKTRRHNFRHHPEEYLKDFPHVCLVCFHVFKTGEELNESHMGIHDDHKCYMCGRYNIKQTNFENHMRTHTGEKPFFCTFCPSSFSTPYTLKIHVQMHAKYKHKESKDI